MRKQFELWTLFFLVMSFNSCAQKEVEPPIQQADVNKMDAFVSRKGAMLKFQDTNLSPIKLMYGAAETRIRKISSGTESKFFYQIEIKAQYSREVGSIAYDDLLDLIKALGTLESDQVNDIALNPDYLENRYVTDDGLQLGYLVSKGKATWYIKLDDRGSDNTLFVASPAFISTALVEAKLKIEELSK